MPISTDAGSATSAVTTDARGFARVVGGASDIGAVEVTQDDYQVEALVVTPKFTG